MLINKAYCTSRRSGITLAGAPSFLIFCVFVVKNKLDVGDLFYSSAGFQAQQLNEWTYEKATSAEINDLIALLDHGLNEGVLGVGMIIQHTPGARREEIFRLFQLAAKRGVLIEDNG